jgi:hypothetical protein
MIDPTGFTSLFFHAYTEGLGASLRAIAGAVMVSKHFGLPLHLQWTDRPACPGELSDWFQADDWTIVPEKQPNSFSLHGSDLLAGASPTYVAHMHILHEVMTAETFDELVGEVVRAWQLQPALQQKLDTLETSKKLSERVGLHIRRTDKSQHAKKLGWDYTDDEVFARINNLDPNEKVFLATCGPAASTKYRAAFPSRIAVAPYNFLPEGNKRRTPTEDAVIDMYALSRCKEMWGSQGSAFTDFAEVLSGKKAYRFGKENQDDPLWCDVRKPK